MTRNPGPSRKFFSRREQQVLSHVLAGRTSREIGDLLGPSVRTGEFHRANLMAKLDAPTAAELVAEVRRRGWSRAPPPAAWVRPDGGKNGGPPQTRG